MWTERASSSAPTSCRGRGVVPIGLAVDQRCPESGASRPRISRIVVDLPDPLGPRKPVTIPGRTLKVRSRTATFSP